MSTRESVSPSSKVELVSSSRLLTRAFSKQGDQIAYGIGLYCSQAKSSRFDPPQRVNQTGPFNTPRRSPDRLEQSAVAYLVSRPRRPLIRQAPRPGAANLSTTCVVCPSGSERPRPLHFLATHHSSPATNMDSISPRFYFTAPCNHFSLNAFHNISEKVKFLLNHVSSRFGFTDSSILSSNSESLLEIKSLKSKIENTAPGEGGLFYFQKALIRIKNLLSAGQDS